MPRNVEIKARVADREALERRVAALADDGPHELRQRDTFFAVAEGRLKLREQEGREAELIGYERTDASGPAPSHHIRARTREPARLVRTLGELLGILGTVRKRRTLYRIGRTRVHLDRVERLGDWVELEVVLGPNEPEAGGRAEAAALMRRLGIQEPDLEALSYLDLLRAEEAHEGPESDGSPTKLTGLLLAGAAAAATLGGCSDRSATTAESMPDAASAPGTSRPLAQQVLVIAHRGASAYAPEHTLRAWDLALEMGADFIEQDLQMTADGVLVVMHDDRLDRTASGGASCSGPVRERTLEEIRSCDVGSWFDAAHPEHAHEAHRGLTIPTLDEVLDRYGGSARFYIETKSPEEAPGMEAALVARLDEHGLLDRTAPARVILQSFAPASLLQLAELAPELPRVQLIPRRWSTSRTIAALQEISTYAQGIGPAAERVDARLVEAAHAAELLVHPYTVNDPAEMDRLLAIGVDGLFTDRPDVARSRVDRLP